MAEPPLNVATLGHPAYETLSQIKMAISREYSQIKVAGDRP
jgi:hypothetical protein